MLQQKIASLYGVDNAQIVLSRGSDEGIDLLIRLFCYAGQDAIMICPPTYGMYAVSARLQGASIIEVPLLKEGGYQLDVRAILAKWNPSVKIIFLCSPNNPTGNLLNQQDILYVCEHLQGKSIVVVDEAYIDYANTESMAAYIKQYAHLVILRTLSKAYGLAGARLGIVLGQEELMQWVLKIIAPYPLSALTSNFIFKALSPQRQKKIKKQITQINSEKKRLSLALRMLPLVRNIFPSDANFLLVEMLHAENVMNACKQQGIVLRSMFDKPGLNHCIRISIGLSDENTRLITVLEKMR